MEQNNNPFNSSFPGKPRWAGTRKKTTYSCPTFV